jgi:hypothetical protein
VELELLSILGHQSSSPVFSVVRVAHKEVRIDCKDKFEGITVVIRSHKEVRIDCKDKFEGITVVIIKKFR